MDNLKLINELVENEGFVVDNDSKAEWALNKIKEEKIESDRYIKACEDMISEYKFKIENEKQKHANKISYFERQLQCYLDTVKKKINKTQATYRLPGGILKIKYSTPDIIRDDKKLIEWCSKSGNTNLIKVEEKLNWAEFKKNIVFKDNYAIDSHGVIIDGIELKEKGDKFIIELND